MIRAAPAARLPEQLWLTSCLFRLSEACSVGFRFLAVSSFLGQGFKIG
jgi:hypothetical protein